MEEERDDLVSVEDVVEEQQQDEHVDERQHEEEGQHESQDNEQEDDDVVQRAKKYGHLSKDEWIAQGKDPDQYKSPEEFDKTGKILEQIYSMRKKLDTRDREIQSLVEYQQRTSQREYDRAKQELQGRLAMAKDDMDMDAVAHYTKEITRAETLEQNNQQQSMQGAQQAALNQFHERNKHWFNDQNPDLQRKAVQIDEELKSIYPNATYEELAEKIEKRMQYEHPDRVLGQSRSRAPQMSHSQSAVNKSAAGTASPDRAFRGLSQDLKDTYQATKRIIESQGNRQYTQADFISQLRKDGEL